MSCGGFEDAPEVTRNSELPTTVNSKKWVLRSATPVMLSLKSESLENPNILVSTQRTLLPHEYDVLHEPIFEADRQSLTSFVTGIGVDIVDLENNNLVVGLGIEAREYNSKTGYFSPTTRIFAAQGEDLSNAQNFVILNSESPNYMFTGFGFRLKEARMKSLALQRKTLSSLMEEGSPISASKTLTLPPGWVAVGLVIKIVPKIPEGKTILDIPVPYVQDMLMYIGNLRYE